jgi:hypothetical protein
MLCFIIQEIGFVENINFKSTFFWVFFLPTYFLLFFLLSNTWIDRWSKAPETLKDKNDSESKAIKTKYEANIHNKTNKEEHETMKTPEIDKEEHETMKTPEIDKEQIEKQFFYDFSNPCPYCDTEFEHTALHCAVYFSDIERLKEVIELIKKVDGVEDYKNSAETLYGHILKKTDLRGQIPLTLAILMKNTDFIKLLMKTTGASGFDVYNPQHTIDTIEWWMPINLDDDESIKLLIDLYQYKKH